MLLRLAGEDVAEEAEGIVQSLVVDVPVQVADLAASHQFASLFHVAATMITPTFTVHSSRQKHCQGHLVKALFPASIFRQLRLL